MKRIRVVSVAAALTVSLFCGLAAAEVVTVEFTGTIVGESDIPGVSAGDTFSGSMSWDSAQGGVAVDAPAVYSFLFDPPLAAPGATVTVFGTKGEQTYAQSSNQSFTMYVWNDLYPGTPEDGISGDFYADGGTWKPVLQILLFDYDGALWDTASALPTTLDVGDIDFAQVTITDVWGGSASGVIESLTIGGGSPPTAEAGGDQTVECTGTSGASVTLDGSGSSDPDGGTLTYEWDVPGVGTYDGAGPTITLPVGTYTITLTVTDEDGETATDTVEITVQDTTAPVITAISASPSTLGPVNHKMITVKVSVSATDACDPTPGCRIVSVSSNQATSGSGSGNTSQDWDVTGELTLDLRAERSGSDGDRVYTITVECRDDSGNTSTGTVAVTVPHDKRKK